MGKVVIIADDLTGACDTGIKLVESGCNAEVIIDANMLPGALDGENTFYAINTNTRSADRDEAYHTVREVATQVCTYKPDMVYKKIDSVLRGNIGAEVDAVMDAAGYEMAIIAPALPESRRIVKDGVLHVHLPFSEHMEQDVISSLYGSEGSKHIKINSRHIRLGSRMLAQKLETEASRGCRHCVLDSETEEDLQTIANAIKLCRTKVLPVGSAGLARHLFNGADPSSKCSGKLSLTECSDALGLIVVTSRHPLTVVQVRKLLGRSDVAAFSFPVEELDTKKPEAVAEELSARIFAHRKRHRETRLYIVTTDAVAGNAPPEFRPLGENLSDDRIVAAATMAAAAAARAMPFTAVIASGGDTAIGFLENFNISSIQLIEEPSPGTVAAKMEALGEPARLLLTKSGGLGDENTLVDMAEYILTTRVAAG